MLFVYLNVVCIYQSECCIHASEAHWPGSAPLHWDVLVTRMGHFPGTQDCRTCRYILYIHYIYIYTCRIYIQPRILYKCLETTNCASSLLLLQYNAMNTKGHSCDVSSCISDQKNHLQQNCLYGFVNS